MSELIIAPPEAVPSSAKHYSESDNTLGHSVILFKNYRRIFIEMAELPFKIDDTELATLAVWNIKNSADFIDQEVGLDRLFETKEENEPNIYGPSIKMGNYAVRRVLGVSGPQANRIKLILCGDKILMPHFAAGKPDILLVSQNDHECASFDKQGICVHQGDFAGVKITHGKPLWWHVLLRSEFKEERCNEDKDRGKRPFDSLAEQGDMENNRPTKTSRSSTSRGHDRPTRVSLSLRDQGHVFIAEARKIESDHLVQVCRQATGGDDFPSEQLREICSRKSQEYEKKGVLLLGDSISKIEGTVIFQNVFMQYQRCAYKLYSKGGFIYRDISINDLGFYIADNEEYNGVLLDFDLASVEVTPKPTRVRSGTSFFMAREALDVSKAYAHRFRHELESFLYVLIWHTLGYRQENAEQVILYEWRRGSWNSNMEAKEIFIMRDWMETFRSAGADEGFLHIRCRSICYAYFSVAHDLARKEASSTKFLFQKAPKEAQEELDSSATEDAVTFRHWLKRIGETVDEACYEDCCLCSE